MEGIDTKRGYTNTQTAEKLHRIADAIAAGRSFRVQINGHRFTIPSDALIDFELEDNGEAGELEVEMKWNRSEN